MKTGRIEGIVSDLEYASARVRCRGFGSCARMKGRYHRRGGKEAVFQKTVSRREGMEVGVKALTRTSSKKRVKYILGGNTVSRLGI